MSEFIDILLFGAIAVFLVYRLRSILGSTDGKIVNLKTKRPQTKFKPKIVPKNDNDEFLKGANKALFAPLRNSSLSFFGTILGLNFVWGLFVFKLTIFPSVEPKILLRR